MRARSLLQSLLRIVLVSAGAHRGHVCRRAAVDVVIVLVVLFAGRAPCEGRACRQSGALSQVVLLVVILVGTCSSSCLITAASVADVPVAFVFLALMLVAATQAVDHPCRAVLLVLIAIAVAAREWVHLNLFIK